LRAGDEEPRRLYTVAGGAQVGVRPADIVGVSYPSVAQRSTSSPYPPSHGLID
jgi:hypothetical protein